jgi:hypothetical protein
MTAQRFAAVLAALPFVFAAGLWMYAFSLAGPIGRNRLGLGIPALFHHGRHVIEHGSEEERVRDFADQVAEARTMRLETVIEERQADELVGFTQEIRRVQPLPEDEVPADAKAAFQAAVDAAVEDFRTTLDAMIEQYLSAPLELTAA